MDRASDWISRLEEFCKINMSVEDYDLINSPFGIERVTLATIKSISGNRDWLKSNVAGRFGRLSVFRNKIR